MKMRGRSVAKLFAVAIAVFAALAHCRLSEAEEFSGQVIGVTDGDTITVLHAGYPERIRLAGIDCPEKRQAFGYRAKQLTSYLAFGKEVLVQAQGRDKYGPTIGEIVLPDCKSLNRELVRTGLAWWYRKYSSDQDLARLEYEARSAHAGLWAEPDAIPPWVFRHVSRGLR